jgi:glutamate/tyrosine decarboxylase-like PLP-dependent enzyme
VTAHDELAAAIGAGLSAGLIVPCAGQADRFTSDDLQELEKAAAECEGCPVLDECRAAGTRQVWGVWGGRVAWPSCMHRPTGRRRTRGAA